MKSRGLHRKKRNGFGRLRHVSVGFIIGAVLFASAGAYAGVRELVLSDGTSANVTCKTSLTNTNVATQSETVTCAAKTKTPPPPPPPPLTSQAITFTSPAPTGATAGDATYTVTATGGASGNPVTFTIDPSSNGACSISGAVVSFLANGTCVIDANQAGNASYAAAPQVQQSFGVTGGTTPPPPPPGSNCTNPSFMTSEATGTENIDGGAEYYWVNNDAWSGSHGPQTIYVCNQSSWNAVSDQPNDGGQVETYPDTEYDVGGRNSPSTTTISAFQSITSIFSEAFPSVGGWDAAYDLWTDNWTNETMVWNQWAGNNGYWADCAESGNSESYCGEPQSGPVTIDGVSYHFLANGPSSGCNTSNESNCEMMFFRDTQVSSGSVDLLAVFQWEVANGFAKASDVPTQLEYGVEISYTSGTETFPLTGLTFSVTP